MGSEGSGLITCRGSRVALLAKKLEICRTIRIQAALYLRKRDTATPTQRSSRPRATTVVAADTTMPETPQSPVRGAKRSAETEAGADNAQRPRVDDTNVNDTNVHAAAADAERKSVIHEPPIATETTTPDAPVDAPAAIETAAASTAPGAAASASASAGAGAGGGTAMIRGLPKTWDEFEFRKWLDSLVIARASFKKKKNWPYAFITFAFLDDRLRATATLEGCLLGGKPVTVHDAVSKKPGDTSVDGNADHQNSAGKTREQLIVAAADRGARRDVRDVVCSLWATPYADQLKLKQAKVEEALKNLTRHTAKNCKRTKKQGAGGTWRWPSWIGESNKRGKLAAPVVGIVRSPVLEGYRNKSEFTVGPCADGQNTVGFNVGLFKEGVTAVASAETCRHISFVAKTLASACQNFLREEAKDPNALPVWDKRKGTGFWRLLVVREGGLAPDTGAWNSWLRNGEGEESAPGGDGNSVSASNKNTPETSNDKNTPNETESSKTVDREETGLPYPRQTPNTEVMVVVQVSRAGYDPAKILDSCARLAAALTTAGTENGFPVTRKLLQIHEGCANAAAADALLLHLEDGEPTAPEQCTIHEEMCGLKFTLSANAFFQVNTCAAEALYHLAGEWASPSGRSLLLDVCCGTGTIGLTLASRVKKVVGVDIVEAAILDAAANASLNGVTNCEWVAGDARVVLPDILKRYQALIKPPPATATETETPGTLAASVADRDPEESGGEEEEASLAAVSAARAAEAVTAAAADAAADASGKVYEYDDVVAIVDPPRAGLHKNVLHSLRAETRLQRLVYVSCNPESMALDCSLLCTPQGPLGDSGGAPFRPVKAMAVDLFPHTPHCEAVLLLER